MPCDYMTKLLKLAESLAVEPGKLSLVSVLHDPWCEEIGGDGSKPCVPEFELDGKPIEIRGA